MSGTRCIIIIKSARAESSLRAMTNLALNQSEPNPRVVNLLKEIEESCEVMMQELICCGKSATVFDPS